LTAEQGDPGAWAVHKEALMDLGKSFTFMFEDKDWIAKLGIGGLIVLLSIFIIPIPLVVGYALALTKRVAEGDPTPLPEWTNLGDMYVKGLTAIVGVLVWSIPIIVLACCASLINVSFVSTASNDGSGAQALSGVGGILLACISCLLIIVGIAISLFVYAPLTNFALNNQVATFWDFRGNWNFIRANSSNYLIAFLLALVANFIAGLGTIACFIGVFFTSFWGYLVAAHLFGQVARLSTAPPGSTMLPPTPPPMDQPPSVMQGPTGPAPAA
jgi:hypothetical protein